MRRAPFPGHFGDHGEHKPAAVRDLLVPMALRPSGASGRPACQRTPATGVEVVLHKAAPLARRCDVGVSMREENSVALAIASSRVRAVYLGAGRALATALSSSRPEIRARRPACRIRTAGLLGGRRGRRNLSRLVGPLTSSSPKKLGGTAGGKPLPSRGKAHKSRSGRCRQKRPPACKRRFLTVARHRLPSVRVGAASERWGGPRAVDVYTQLA